jgi:GDP-mannose 6-dehydrogenase
MKIAVFGLGYVGTITAALLAREGHDVVGIDPHPLKSQAVREGRTPVCEPDLPDILAAAVSSGRLTAVQDASEAADWEVAFVCVGTPSGRTGELNHESLGVVLDEIGSQLRGADAYRVVAIRSTLLPHVFREVLRRRLHAAAGSGTGRYGVVVTPEFLREGSSVRDFMNPPFILIGEDDAAAGDVVADVMSFVRAPLVRLPVGEALMVKYASNAFHALKIAFANEVGVMCGRDGLDAHLVMSTLCRDDKFNISTRYLRPGFAFGGSCLPKDLRALLHHNRDADVETPVLRAILSSNAAYLQGCVERVVATEAKRVGIVGLTFKRNTDDLRESPMVALTEALIGKGKLVTIHDPQLDLQRLTGANRAFIEMSLPHLASLLKPTLAEVVASSEVIVTAHYGDEVRAVLESDGHGRSLVDFADGLAFRSRSLAPVGGHAA